jgi:hypothetical protein
MRVLVACEFSGVVRDAFLARGHDAWSCDLLPNERPGPHIQDDVLKGLSEILAIPDSTIPTQEQLAALRPVVQEGLGL